MKALSQLSNRKRCNAITVLRFSTTNPSRNTRPIVSIIRSWSKMTTNVVCARKNLEQNKDWICILVTITKRQYWCFKRKKYKKSCQIMIKSINIFFLWSSMPHVFVAIIPWFKCFLAITTFFVMFYQLLTFLTIGFVCHYGFVVKNSKIITALQLAQ